jgi:hypothetical protein
MPLPPHLEHILLYPAGEEFNPRLNLDASDTWPFDCLRLNSFSQRFGELAQIFFLFLPLV